MHSLYQKQIRAPHPKTKRRLALRTTPRWRCRSRHSVTGRLFPFQAARSMRSIGLRSNLARNLPDSTGRIFPLPESALTSGVHDKDRDAAEKDEDRADDCTGATPLRSGGDRICSAPVEQCSEKHQQELGDD